MPTPSPQHAAQILAIDARMSQVEGILVKVKANTRAAAEAAGTVGGGVLDYDPRSAKYREDLPEELKRIVVRTLSRTPYHAVSKLSPGERAAPQICMLMSKIPELHDHHKNLLAIAAARNDRAGSTESLRGRVASMHGGMEGIGGDNPMELGDLLAMDETMLDELVGGSRGFDESESESESGSERGEGGSDDGFDMGERERARTNMTEGPVGLSAGLVPLLPRNAWVRSIREELGSRPTIGRRRVEAVVN